MDPKSTADDTRPAPGATERIRISCPGCGRNDHVSWPRDAATFPWTCFNCGKRFDLARPSAAH